MTQAEQLAQFEGLRPLLFAYRILSSVSEAEDAVQETWLRWEASDTRPDSVKAYLSAVVTRVSINVLDSAKVRREKYVGLCLPRCTGSTAHRVTGRRVHEDQTSHRDGHASAGSPAGGPPCRRRHL